MYGVVRGRLFVIKIFECLVKMDEDHWMYDTIMFEKVDMNEQNDDQDGVKSKHVDCSDAFKTSHVLI